MSVIGMLRHLSTVEWSNLDQNMGLQQQLWVVTAEILVKPGDMASGETKGFTNIVTWANSPETAQQKISQVLKGYGWEVLGIESARRFDESGSYSDELLDIVEKAKTNPNACIYGTVFSYKPD
jgi:hypothetical protein